MNPALRNEEDVAGIENDAPRLWVADCLFEIRKRAFCMLPQHALRKQWLFRRDLRRVGLRAGRGEQMEVLPCARRENVDPLGAQHLDKEVLVRIPMQGCKRAATANPDVSAPLLESPAWACVLMRERWALFAQDRRAREEVLLRNVANEVLGWLV